MKRRNFIYTGVAVAVGLGAGSYFLVDNESKWKKQPFLYPFILSNFLNEESLRVIGESFRAMNPDENSKVKLLNAITLGINVNQYNSKGATDLAQEIEKKVEIDFKSEKMLLIKGWVISETEARQCGLLSLS
jgi:hypothetical protein